MRLDYKKITEKWQHAWNEEKLFESKLDKSKEAFYIQVAYPYPSGAMHIGHARTYGVTDIVAKYHMMRGYNVLFPMGWHVSGTPVIATVDALNEGDKATIKRCVEDYRIPKKDLEKMKTPEGFVNYMINEAEYGYKAGFAKLGLGIDWRHELTTMDSHYNKFITWQYRKLHEKGLIGKGKYPVRYCPKDKQPVGDHDLSKGEGIGIQEYTLLKFKLTKRRDGKVEPNTYLIAATLRPETVYGQTNIWISPDADYVSVTVDENGKIENWIVSKEALVKLREQKKITKESKSEKGSAWIASHAMAPGIEKEVPIYPAGFVDPNIGSGIVTSVPGHAPFDYIAIVELKEDKQTIQKFKLAEKELQNIEIVGIISTPKYGEMASPKLLEELGIKSQKDTEKLEQAKQIIYKEEHHQGIMGKRCGKYSGKPVKVAKEEMKKDLIKLGKADRYFELMGTVVCRCQTPCLVKVLDDQWFIHYGNDTWKKESTKTLSEMKIVPELYRKQYEHVFGWLENKPCTRAKGLGTKFPMDETKMIEPLSDSTIYMTYFTISHLINQQDAEKLTDDVFDFIFLAKGDAKKVAQNTGLKESALKEMKESFEYWYPLQFNVSAVELIPNHMSFSIFQHTAIFPKAKRQKGTLNLGMLIRDGVKMSSSKGNLILINDICDKIGADNVRFFLMNNVEPWEEMDWRSDEVSQGLKTWNHFLEGFATVIKSKKATAKNDAVDLWLENRFQDRVNKYLSYMDTFEFRKALQEMSYSLINDLHWYDRRKGGKPQGTAYTKVIEAWIKCIAPFMPHLAEEFWRGYLGNKRSIFATGTAQQKKINQELNQQETVIIQTERDIRQIQELAKIKKPKKITIYIASPWKWKLLQELNALEKPSFGDAMKVAMKNADIRKHGKQAERAVKDLSNKIMDLKGKPKINEQKALESAQDFFKTQFDCTIEVKQDTDAAAEQANKANNAMPFKPAIWME